MKTKKNFFRWIILFLMIFVFSILLVNIFEFIFKEIYISNIKNNLNISYILEHINSSSNDDFIPTLDLTLNLTWNGREYNSKILLFEIGKWIIKLTNDIGTIFIGTFQDIITILFSGSIFYNAIGMKYDTYFWIILGIFFFLLLVFLSIKFFKIGIGKGTSRNIGKNIFNSFVLLIMIFFIFQILFLGTEYFFINIIGIKSFSFDVFDKIKDYTIGNIHKSFLFKWSHTIKYTITIEIPEFASQIKIHLIFNFRGAHIFINKIKIVYLFAFIFSVYFITFNLIKFSIKLFIRIIDILYFSFVGIPLAAASSLEDGGNKMNNWNRTLIRKVFNPLLSFSVYLFILIFINVIFSSIDNNFNVISDKWTIFSLKFIVINGAFMILNTLSKKIDKKSIALKENNYDGNDFFTNNNGKKIDYSFNENRNFLETNNELNKKINSNHSISKNYFDTVDIYTTLEKIKDRE